MATIRKVDKKWLAEVRSKGFYKSKRFDTKMHAQSWALEIEQMRGKHGGIVAGNTLGDAFRKYAIEISPKKKGARWEIIRLKKLQRDPISNISLMQLSTDDLQKWVDSSKLQPASIIREFQLVSSVLSTCRKQWKWLADDIAKDVIKPRKPPPRDRIATQKEINDILLALDYHEGKPPLNKHHEIAIAVILALETGMRQGEIMNMEWQHIYFDKLYLRLPDSKNGYGRDVSLSSRAVEVLKLFDEKKEGAVFTVSKQVLDVTYRRAVKLAGISGLTFHDLRHTAITTLSKKLPLLALARQVGHRDIRNLQIYYNETATEIAKLMD